MITHVLFVASTKNLVLFYRASHPFILYCQAEVAFIMGGLINTVLGKIACLIGTIYGNFTTFVFKPLYLAQSALDMLNEKGHTFTVV